MARGRMIDQGFTRSDKLNSIPRDARLVYASILTILDREGRTCAEPLVLKVNVFRKSDFTVEEIITAVAQLAAAGLIRLYADNDNDAILEYVRFLDFNSPNSRERASDYPSPDGENAKPLRDPELLAALEAQEPSIDRADAPSSTTTQPPTDNARATHMHSPRHVQGNVNGTGTLTRNENEKLSSTSELANHHPPQVEAKPRRETRSPPRYEKFIETWNQHRGPLPRIQGLNADRRTKLDRLRKELGDEALEIFTDAVRQVANEPYWREKGFGFGNLLTGGKVLNWAEKYRSSDGLTDSDRRLADKAAKVAQAIGGLS